MSYSIQLSPELYRILQQQAIVLNATVESLVETAVRRNYAHPGVTKPNGSAKGQGSNSINHSVEITNLPKELTDELDQLAFLTDEELWQAARTQLNDDDHRRMESMLYKQQAAQLRPDEVVEAEMLVDHYDRILLIRSKAAVLLKERGHNITSLGPDPS